MTRWLVVRLLLGAGGWYCQTHVVTEGKVAGPLAGGFGGSGG